MEELYKKYSTLIYHYLYGLTNDSEISEELMQETFCSALKTINRFKGECKISVWLCQIAKNKWKDYLTKKHKVNTIAIDNIDELYYLDTNLDDISEKEELINLYKQIHKLEENTREVFYIRIKANLTFKDIGDILGKTEEWARVTFYRGKIKLKGELLKNEKQ